MGALLYCTKNGSICHLPNSETLCSLTQFVSEGATVFTDKEGLFHVSWPNGDEIVFDRTIKTKHGWVPAIEMSFLTESDYEVSYKSWDTALSVAGTVNINDLHDSLGHPSMAMTRMTAEKYKIAVTGQAKACTACMMGKAKRKRLNKEPVERATKPGERLFLDITSPKPVS